MKKAIDYTITTDDIHQFWTFQIIDQTEDLRCIDYIYTDAETGLKIRSVVWPAYSAFDPVIFIRGNSKSLDNKISRIPYGNQGNLFIDKLRRTLDNFNDKWLQEHMYRELFIIDKELFTLND